MSSLLNKITLTVFAILSIFYFTSLPALAQNGDSQIKVDHIAGNIEKIGEKLSLFLKFDSKSKLEFYEYLAEKRLAELEYVVNKEDHDNVEITASRYATYISNLTNYAEANQVKEEKEDLVKLFERHALAVSSFRDKYKFESGWWLAIQHDVNLANQFHDKFKNW